jgi:hypothetical protein
MLIACGGMALLGVAAMMTQWVKEGWLTQWHIPHDPIATLALSFISGVLVGLVSCWIVVPTLMRKNLRGSFVVVYGPSLAVTVAYVYLTPTGVFGPAPAALLALISVCLLSILSWVLLPNCRFFGDSECPDCGYDLRGAGSPYCPECGRAVA